MSHKEIPCPKCRRVWLWADWKKPEEAECPVGEGCNIIPEKSDTETMIEDNFNEILRRLDKIEKTIRDITIPSYPNPSRTVPFPPPYIPQNSCTKCGMSLEGVMGYVCNDRDCPTFMKVTC
jgi:hypothetical protein